MPETNKLHGPKGPYYDGKTHFSYNNDLVYHTHQYKSRQTFQNMVDKAEQSITDNQFKG